MSPQTDNIHAMLARLDERQNAFEGVLERMAEDQGRLSTSFEKLVESQQRVALIENDIVYLKKSNETLWGKIDAHAREHHTTLSKVLWEVVRVGGGVLVGALVAWFKLH